MFDEDVPGKLARALLRQIHIVVGMQWGGIKNGALLRLIGRERFNVFLTGDKNMDKQRRLDWPVVRWRFFGVWPTAFPLPVRKSRSNLLRSYVYFGTANPG